MPVGITSGQSGSLVLPRCINTTHRNAARAEELPLTQPKTQPILESGLPGNCGKPAQYAQSTIKVIHAEELPAHPPAPTVEQWIAANERRQVAAYANPDASTAFVVEYVAPDGIVINYGKSVVAIYPKPDGTELHAGDRIVISEGALCLPAEQKKGGTQI